MPKKHETSGRKPKDSFLASVGKRQYYLGVRFEDGPCFQTPRQLLAWQKGWLTVHAFNEGLDAGMDRKTLSHNPYAQSFTTAPPDFNLAEEWRKGFRAGYTAINS